MSEGANDVIDQSASIGRQLVQFVAVFVGLVEADVFVIFVADVRQVVVDCQDPEEE